MVTTAYSLGSLTDIVLDGSVAPVSFMPEEDNYVRKARLKAVADGDTVRLIIDVGFRSYQEHSIRLSGVAANNLHRGTEDEKALGRECRQFVIRWFERHKTICGTTAKWPFVVISEKSDSFGRFLGVVYCLQGHSLNDDILKSGLAEPYQKKMNGAA